MLQFNRNYKPQLNNNDLIVIEDIILAYKENHISLSHRDVYAGYLSWSAQMNNAISWQLDELYSEEVKVVINDYNQAMDSCTGSTLGTICSTRRNAARELTERMVEEHYSADDQFTFMIATA